MRQAVEIDCKASSVDEGVCEGRERREDSVEKDS